MSTVKGTEEAALRQDWYATAAASFASGLRKSNYPAKLLSKTHTKGHSKGVAHRLCKILHDSVYLPTRFLKHINPGAVQKELNDADAKVQKGEGSEYTTSYRAIITYKHARSAACAINKGEVKVLFLPKHIFTLQPVYGACFFTLVWTALTSCQWLVFACPVSNSGMRAVGASTTSSHPKCASLKDHAPTLCSGTTWTARASERFSEASSQRILSSAL